MIQVIQGFKPSTRDPIDNRLVLTKAEMVAINDNQMPDKYFAICKDDGRMYAYNKSATASSETGKFTLYGDTDIIIYRGYYYNKKFYKEATHVTELNASKKSIYVDDLTNIVYTYDGTKFISINDTLPTASGTVNGISKLYTVSGQNSDGAVTQKEFTDAVSSIKFAIDPSDSECLVLNVSLDS